MQIVVIGAGMVGAAVTYRLAEAGAEVTTLDAGRPGGGASGASFASVNGNAFLDGPREYFDLVVESMREHVALTEELGEGSWLKLLGSLTWAGDEQTRVTLRANVERLNGLGYPSELLTPLQARELEPDLRLNPDDEIVFFPGEGWVVTLLLINALLNRATALGAEVLPHTRVVEVTRNEERVEGVVTEAGERLGADVVINCAGPWAAEVAGLAGIDLPLRREPGMLAYSPPIATSLKRLCMAPTVHFRPDGGGRIVAGWHDDPLALYNPDPLSPQALLERLAQWLPALSGVGVEASRIGVRPIPEDGLPMIGFVPGVQSFYTVVSHSAVTLGPLLGRLVAAETYTGQPDPRLALFRPSRFLTGSNS